MADRLARPRGRLETSTRARHYWPAGQRSTWTGLVATIMPPAGPAEPAACESLNLDDSSQTVTRRWTVIASGLLLSAMALVVIYTGRAAFHSWLAVVVVAAIGMAALLLQLRLQHQSPRRVRAPIWLNSIGVLCSLLTIAADWLHLGLATLQIVALAAVGCFAVGGFVILAGLRRNRA